MTWTSDYFTSLALQQFFFVQHFHYFDIFIQDDVKSSWSLSCTRYAILKNSNVLVYVINVYFENVNVL